MMKKILTTIEKILRSAAVTNTDTTKAAKNEKEGLSIEKKIYGEMLKYFKDIVVSRSVGKSMVFHMGYIVWLEPSDFTTVCQELKVIVPEIIDGFYEIIKEQRQTYPKCRPASTDWFFQITPTSVVPQGSADSGMNDFINLEKGKFIISSTFHSVNQARPNVQQQPNVVLSFRPLNSDATKDLNVNRDLMLGIEAIGDTIIQPFNYSKCGLEVTKDDIHEMHGYATLRFNAKGKNASYLVMDKNFFVSGSADKRNQRSVLVLPDSSVEVGHLVFRYNEGGDFFEVAAYGRTILNERRLELSTRDDTRWYRVSANASFLLGDGMGLSFVQNKITDKKQ